MPGLNVTRAYRAGGDESAACSVCAMRALGQAGSVSLNGRVPFVWKRDGKLAELPFSDWPQELSAQLPGPGTSTVTAWRVTAGGSGMASGEAITRSAATKQVQQTVHHNHRLRILLLLLLHHSGSKELGPGMLRLL